MKASIPLIPIIAAAGMALAGCQQSGGDATAADDTAAATPASGTAAAELLAQGAATGETCGTIAGILCASDADYCATEMGQCGVADVSGTCTAKPQFCTDVYDPVCGCDGETYSNACYASAAGMNVQSKGECPSGEG